MDSSIISLSVALVTRNRPDSLERTLKSLRAQSVQPWEVIISDDSDHCRAAEVAALAAKYECRYLSGPQRGLYANRNHAALAVRGTHLRTMDDDHEFPERHIEACIEALAYDPFSVWNIGEFYPGQETKGQTPVCPGQIHPRGYSVTPTDPQRSWAISDGANIYPRQIFDCGLRFIDDYMFGAAYLEFGSRLHWLGFRLRFLTTTHVIHHYDPTTRSFLDISIDLSSRFCAMLCHSFLYQPKPINKILCGLEMWKQLVLHRRIAFKAISAGKIGFNKQRNLLSDREEYFRRSANQFNLRRSDRHIMSL